MLEDLREIEEQYEAVEADLARPDIVLVGIIAIGTLGHLLDAVFIRLSRRLIPWQKLEQDHAQS